VSARPYARDVSDRPAPRHLQFDFDGVLLRRDSTATFIVRELRRRPARLAVAVVPAVAYLAARPVPRLQGRLARLLLRLTMHGMTAEQVRTSLAELAREMAADERVAVRPAVEALREAMARGDRVLVNSASFEDFLVPFLATHDLEPEVVGSTLRATAHGTAMDRHNHGHEKVRSARAAGWQASCDVVVSDSLSDLPLLATARRAVMVDVSDRVAQRVRRSTTAEVEVVHWC
jgi:phosphoserine phosphatase